MCETVSTGPFVLRRRPLPDRLRYLAEQLRSGTHWSVVAIVLEATADEVEANDR